VRIAEAQGTCDNVRVSDEELIQAKRRTLDEYQRCKHRLAVLGAEAERISTVLPDVITFLHTVPKGVPLATGSLEGLLDGKAVTLINDLRMTEKNATGYVQCFTRWA